MSHPKQPKQVAIPWISNKIKTLVRKRNRTHALYKKTGNIRLRNKWRVLRSQVKKDIRAAHNNYVNKMVGDVHQDPKPFWKYINSQRKDQPGIPPLKSKTGNIAETDYDKAETLNAQFTSVFTQTTYDQVPFYPSSTPKMKDIKIDPEGIQKLLHNTNPNKALGPDGIHPRVLKELAPELFYIICHLFQQSIVTGSIPEEWKSANICPLYKKNDRSLPSNYRPVSIMDVHML